MSYGTGKYRYELVDEKVNLPEGLSFFGASGLAIDSQDRVYLLSRTTYPLLVFDREGNLVTRWKDPVAMTTGLCRFRSARGRAHGICVGPDGSVYCTDDGNNHTVSKFTPDGELLMTLGNEGQPSDTGYVREQGVLSIKRGAPPFNRPTGVKLSSSGEIYVSDGYGNARVHKFAPDGTLLLSWGEPGTAPGQFRNPHGLWVDKQERVWVTDRENNRIQIFNAQGEFLSQWTDLGRPTDICIDKDEIVYVSELDTRVSIFTIDGKLLARWGSHELHANVVRGTETGLFVAPHAIAVDSRGAIYVGQNRCVLKFARKM